MAQIVQKLVVAFDICSSTSIIEDLHKTENTTKWKDFLIWMKKYLNAYAKNLGFSVYKFSGDGWILLFDYGTSCNDLFKFLEDFCVQFKIRYKRKIGDFLETPPNQSGLTFGIDRGSLITFIMNQQEEYVGRSINVACRLQSAIKDKDDVPQYKALITKPLFQWLNKNSRNIDHRIVRRKLRNLAGGKDICCVKVKL